MSKKVKVILGSVREGRAGEAVAKWFMEYTKRYAGDVDFELVDLAEVALPFMDEPAPPVMGSGYKHQHTRDWSEMISGTDGFVFITPEYNHGYSPVLKNAIDYLYKEWGGKPAALVGYGSDGAPHSIRQLREILEFVGLKPLVEQVGIVKIWEAFDDNGHIKDANVHGDPTEMITALAEALSAEENSSAA